MLLMVCSLPRLKGDPVHTNCLAVEKPLDLAMKFQENSFIYRAFSLLDV